MLLLKGLTVWNNGFFNKVLPLPVAEFHRPQKVYTVSYDGKP